MLIQIATHPVWFWLSLGGLLLAAEMLGAGGYLLWSGIAAVIVGIIAWLLPLGWQGQGLLFALLTITTAYLWWYWLTKFSAPSTLVNQRDHQLIGQRATLTEPTQDGYGRIKIGDGSWRIWSEIELPDGIEVEVMTVEGITLTVRPVAHSLPQATDDA